MLVYNLDRAVSNSKIRATAVAALSCVLLAAGNCAHAYTCYTLLDRNDNVVYRDTLPPVDLSDEGAVGRNALQGRGEYLMISEADRCPQVAFVFGSAGTTSLSTDEFLNGIRPNGSTHASETTGQVSRGTTALAPPPAAVTAPRAAASSGSAK